MKLVRTTAWALLLTILVCGCGGNRDKGINKDRDRPQATQNK